jgi:hypothetical protein
MFFRYLFRSIHYCLYFDFVEADKRSVLEMTQAEIDSKSKGEREKLEKEVFGRIYS